MKRLTLSLLVIMVASTVGVGQTQRGPQATSSQPSLAEAAAQARAQSKATTAKHVYTNDDFVSSEPAPTVAADAKDASGAEAKTEAKEEKDKDKKDAKAEMAAKNSALKAKIADLKKSIADQQKDISLMEREHQIKTAEYYADAGTQLRTSGQWFVDEKQYQDDLASKKKALSDAQASLDELSEQARKAGVPTS